MEQRRSQHALLSPADFAPVAGYWPSSQDEVDCRFDNHFTTEAGRRFLLEYRRLQRPGCSRRDIDAMTRRYLRSTRKASEVVLDELGIVRMLTGPAAR
jgi:hypothetical protein